MRWLSNEGNALKRNIERYILPIGAGTFHHLCQQGLTTSFGLCCSTGRKWSSFLFWFVFLSEKFRCGAIITFEQYLAIFLLMRLLNTCVLIFGREWVFLGEGCLAHCQVFGAHPHISLQMLTVPSPWFSTTRSSAHMARLTSSWELLSMFQLERLWFLKRTYLVYQTVRSWKWSPICFVQSW